MTKNERRWLGMVIQYPVIVTLGKAAEKAITEIRDWYFPNSSDWDHFFLPHPSGLNRNLNNTESHHEAVRQLKAAYSRLREIKTYEESA